jgi:hypothetical protein
MTPLGMYRVYFFKHGVKKWPEELAAVCRRNY